ncbi:Tyrosine--tRNA ligase, mitochondrial [Armadillidium nasatum]|uniref:Tyrosine--tRNA ligase n=1 Tax=Armadillidium nasatum TaxID=96803 RepID=A0A5N5T5W1_9CRUS|nr:Tyrosine--tRNA ligase, mitochondrial [Armadillidium nasatum]
MLKFSSSKRILKLYFKCSNSIIKRNSSSEGGGILGLSKRGFWNDRYPPSNLDFEQGLASKSLTVYGGFDPTSDSLHIGNLMVINALIHFQREGYSVIALEQPRIGDPSGKKEERTLLDNEIIDKNVNGIKENIERIFSNHMKYIWKKEENLLKPVKIIDNMKFYKKMSVFDFFRDVAKYFGIGPLIGRSFVKSRLTAGEFISAAEFSYQIFQANDWLKLYQKFNCTVQVGGSDQMGNIQTGCDLIKKVENFRVTGKSSGSPVWLNPHVTSPFEFYQYFLRTKDSDVEKYLKLLTFIPLSEIQIAMDIHKQRPEQLKPQKRLAEHLTILVHGESGLKKAKQGTEILFGGNSGVLADMEADDVIDLFRGATYKNLLLKPGITVLDLALMAECFSTESKRNFSAVVKSY